MKKVFDFLKEKPIFFGRYFCIQPEGKNLNLTTWINFAFVKLTQLSVNNPGFIHPTYSFNVQPLFLVPFNYAVGR